MRIPENDVNNTEAQRYHSYLLRIWRSAGSPAWRASLQEVGSAQRWGFADLEALTAFLQEEQGQGREKPDV